MKKIFSLLGVLFLVSTIFFNSALAVVTAEIFGNNSSITGGEVTYPDQINGIVATKDWANVNIKMNIAGLKTGESVTLTLNSDKYAYSKEAFTVGDIHVTPNIDGTWTLTAQKDIRLGNVSLNLKLRYQQSTNQDLIDPIEFSLQDGEKITSKVFDMNILKYSEKVDAKELVRKIPLGFQKDGKIAWVIYFNYNQAGLSSSSETAFVFKDIIGDGHKLEVASIAVYDVANPIVKDDTGNPIRNIEHEAYNYEVTNFLQKQASENGFHYESAQYEIPGDNANAYYIYMETTPTDTGAETNYSNYTYMRTSYAGENAWEDEDTAIISKDESSNGDVAGSVVLKKKDAVSQATLAGAEFKLVNKDTGEVVNTGLVTDQQGQIKLQDLTVGNYEFIETKAPVGYVVNSTPITFQITKDSVNTVYVEALNMAEKAGFKLTKYDAVNKEQTLAGAQFDLYRENGTKITEALLTDKNGQLIVDNLELGRYYLIETKAPDGYVLEQTKLTFEIKAGQTARLELEKTNKRKANTNNLLIKKTDKDTKAKLIGAEFTLYDLDGNIITKGITDKNGELTFTKLKENGAYHLVETKAPVGYELDKTKHLISFKNQANVTITYHVTDTAQKGAIKIVKQDRDTKKRLVGAVFEWKDTTNGFARTKTIGSDGTATISGLSVNRTYEIREIKAPQGYQLDGTIRKVTLQQSDANRVVVHTVNNTVCPPPKVSFHLKLIGCYNEPLKGIPFDMKDRQGGRILRQLQTDLSGTLRANNLTPGNYYFIQTKADYTGFKVRFWLQVSKNGTCKITKYEVFK